MEVTFYIEYHKRPENAGVRDTEDFTVHCGMKPDPDRWPVHRIAKKDLTNEEILAYVQNVLKEGEWGPLVSITRIETETREVPIN